MNAIENWTQRASEEIRRYAELEYRSAIKRALEQRSLEQIARNQTRRTAAAHEAGHAILYASYGDSFKYVKVFQRIEPYIGIQMWGGETMPDKFSGPCELNPSTNQREYLFRARSLIAGLGGETLMGVDTIGSSLDELVMSQVLAQLLAGLCGEASGELIWRNDVWNVTLAIIKANAEPHARVMDALIREKRIDAVRLKILLRDVHPIEKVEEAFAHWRAGQAASAA